MYETQSESSKSSVPNLERCNLGDNFGYRSKDKRLTLPNSNNIKYDESCFKRVVRIRLIEPGICKKIFEPRLNSNTRQLTNKARVLFCSIRRTRKSLKFNQLYQYL